MTAIRALLFDLDGTLVDTHEANFAAYTDAIFHVKNQKVGKDLRDSIKNGESSHVFLPKHLPGITRVEVDAINQHKSQIYPDHLSKSVVNESLKIFIDHMKTSGVAIGLVTTAKKKNAISALEHHGLHSLFNEMVFGDDVEKMKPSPDAYLLALKKLSVTANQAIAFEDSPRGVEAAEAAGIPVIMVKAFND